jgi:hypothetical protein
MLQPTINVGKYVGQLKSDINNKASFTAVMETVHMKLHPSLINTYKITAG